MLLTISFNQSPIGTCLNVIYLPSDDNKGYLGGRFDGLLGIRFGCLSQNGLEIDGQENESDYRIDRENVYRDAP